MPGLEGMTEDRGFKALFVMYPQDTLEVFAPHLLAAYGTPIRMVALQQECALPDLGEASRFLDMALLVHWADGREAVILVIEHWSSAHQVDLRRVLWYVAALAHQHQDAVIQPVLLVTDLGACLVENELTMRVADAQVLQMRVHPVRVSRPTCPGCAASSSITQGGYAPHAGAAGPH